MDECAPGMDPDDDNCHQADHYKRAMLYRSWDLQCDIPDLIDEISFRYLAQFNGRYHWGSKVQYRCLPGFSNDPADNAQVPMLQSMQLNLGFHLSEFNFCFNENFVTLFSSRKSLTNVVLFIPNTMTKKMAES